MKQSRFLAAAALTAAVFCGASIAQSPDSFDDGGPSLVGTGSTPDALLGGDDVDTQLDGGPTLRIVESQPGFSLAFAGCYASAPIILCFGLDAAPFTVDLGPIGRIEMGITYPDFPLPLGAADASGALGAFLARPASLPPGLVGISIAVQGVSVSYAFGPDGQGGMGWRFSFLPTSVVVVQL